MEESLELSGKLASSRIQTNLILGAGNGLRQQVVELEQLVDFEKRTARGQVESMRSGCVKQSETISTTILAKLKEDLTEHFELGKSDLAKVFLTQRHENERFATQIKHIKEENLHLQQGIVRLQKRLKDVEMEIGH